MIPNIQITGRDAYIASQAFVLAIGYIQNLPQERQEWSNMNDMCRVARAIFYPDAVALHVAKFYFSTGIHINFFPDDDDNTIDPGWKAEFDLIVSNYILSFDNVKGHSKNND